MADGIGVQNDEAEPEARERVILVVGAGDATGGSVAKKFASEGYTACLVRRQASKLEQLAQEIVDNGGKAHAFGVDARNEGIGLPNHSDGLSSNRTQQGMDGLF